MSIEFAQYEYVYRGGAALSRIVCLDCATKVSKYVEAVAVENAK
jgi:hypothetical protein